MSNAKIVIALLAAFVLFAFVLLLGAGAFWYFRYYRASTPADVGPLASQALVLPADSALVAGLDVKEFFASPGFKQLASGQIPSLEATVPAEQAETLKKQIREGVEKGLKQAESKTGIRFDRDLDRVVVAASSVDAKTPEGVLIALGRFDRDRVRKAMEASAKSEGASVTSKTVQGVTIDVVTPPGKPGMEIAFLDAGTLVAGSAGAVETVVGNQARHARPLETNQGLMGLVRTLDPASSYFVAIDQPLIARLQKRAPSPPPVPVPKTLTLAGRFEGGLELAGGMADEAAAQGLVQKIEQGLSLVRAQAQANPQVQKIPGASQLLSGIKVTSQAKVVKISVPAAAGGGSSLVGAVAAIAIPSLLRARISANEAAAIGDVRTVISAQAAFSSVARGHYGDLDCLAHPQGCIEGYAGPEFLDVSLAIAGDKNGYRRSFLPEPAGSGPAGYTGFGYTATPVTVGQTGVRSFCGDSSGRICTDPSGAEIVIERGACPRDCMTLGGGAVMMPFPPAPRVERRTQPRPPTPRRSPRRRRVATPPPPTQAPATVAPTPEPTPPPKPVRVGGKIRAPRKIKDVRPVYPSIARQSRVQGIVILEATVGADGKVTNVRVLRSIPMLDAAAMDAVRQWVYTPTLVNGVAVPVIMTVTVRFTLG